MYLITVRGEAETDYEHPQELDGITCEEEFSEYIDDGDFADSMTEKNLRNGYMEFKYEDGKLWTITTYQSDEALTEVELQSLMDYTQGQWSDGIGEGFEQNPCYYSKENRKDSDFDDEDDDDGDSNEVYISPWFMDQEISIQQELVKTKKK